MSETMSKAMSDAMSDAEQETIWIVGASAGIGRALATLYARKGAKLILSARSRDDLEALDRGLGGGHLVLPFDVSDQNGMTQALATLKANKTYIHRALFMAAIYKPQNIKNMDLEFAEDLFDVNVLGCFSFAQLMLQIMTEQGGGQIAICGSVAAYNGLPNGQPYSASKAALKNFAESLYLEAPDSIDIKLISPGFVRTRTTDLNEFDMPFIIEPERAAAEIEKGLNSKAFEIHFPKRFSLQLKLLAMLPYFLSFKIFRKFL